MPALGDIICCRVKCINWDLKSWDEQVRKWKNENIISVTGIKHIQVNLQWLKELSVFLLSYWYICCTIGRPFSYSNGLTDDFYQLGCAEPNQDPQIEIPVKITRFTRKILVDWWVQYSISISSYINIIWQSQLSTKESHESRPRFLRLTPRRKRICSACHMICFACCHQCSRPPSMLWYLSYLRAVWSKGHHRLSVCSAARG